jgi:hypothetical protein
MERHPPVVLSPATSTLLPTPKQTTHHHNGLLLRDILHVSFMPLSPTPPHSVESPRRGRHGYVSRAAADTLYCSCTVPAAPTLPARAQRARARALLAATRPKKRESLCHTRILYDSLTSALSTVIALSAFGHVHIVNC